MYTISNLQNQFFSLVRAGLWGNIPDENFFKEKINWDALYEVSKQQALLGIVLDGIDFLPGKIRPPRPLYLKWCAEVIEIEDANLKLDQEIINLTNLFEKNGIEMILLKGQGIARNYRKPEHRASGDIDIYTGKKFYDQVNKLLTIEGIPENKWESKHKVILWHDSIIENHQFIETLHSPIRNSYFQKIIENWVESGQNELIAINNKKISIPPVDFNVAYILVHAIVHLIHLGLGYRQLCDWTLLIHNKRNEINPKKVENILKKLGLLKACKVFEALAVNYLGLPKEDLILQYKPKDEKTAEFVMNDIWDNGNFGYSRERKRKKLKIAVISQFHTLFHKTKRAFSFFRIAPYEVLWLPFIKSINYISIRRWNAKHKKNNNTIPSSTY